MFLWCISKRQILFDCPDESGTAELELGKQTELCPLSKKFTFHSGAIITNYNRQDSAKNEENG